MGLGKYCNSTDLGLVKHRYSSAGSSFGGLELRGTEGSTGIVRVGMGTGGELLNSGRKLS